MAHEINNPLSYVIGNLDYLGEEIPNLVKQMRASTATQAGGVSERLLVRLDELVDTIEDAREGAGRLRGLVADLKILSHDSDHPDDAVDVEALLDSVIKMLRGEIISRAHLDKSYSQVPQVWVNPARLAQVFLHLLTNAVQALPVGSAQEQRIEVATRVDEAGAVVVEVRDTGPGIAPELQSRVFDPFFTTRQPGAGAGLGLSICQTIVAELGGVISVESNLGRGTSVRVTLPQISRASGAPSRAAP
jgi:signal transduction histidine kinase